MATRLIFTGKCLTASKPVPFNIKTGDKLCDNTCGEHVSRPYDLVFALGLYLTSFHLAESP